MDPSPHRCHHDSGTSAAATTPQPQTPSSPARRAEAGSGEPAAVSWPWPPPLSTSRHRRPSTRAATPPPAIRGHRASWRSSPCPRTRPASLAARSEGGRVDSFGGAPLAYSPSGTASRSCGSSQKAGTYGAFAEEPTRPLEQLFFPGRRGPCREGDQPGPDQSSETTRLSQRLCRNVFLLFRSMTRHGKPVFVLGAWRDVHTAGTRSRWGVSRMVGDPCCS